MIQHSIRSGRRLSKKAMPLSSHQDGRGRLLLTFGFNPSGFLQLKLSRLYQPGLQPTGEPILTRRSCRDCKTQAFTRRLGRARPATRAFSPSLNALVTSAAPWTTLDDLDYTPEGPDGLKYTVCEFCDLVCVSMRLPDMNARLSATPKHKFGGGCATCDLRVIAGLRVGEFHVP